MKGIFIEQHSKSKEPKRDGEVSRAQKEGKAFTTPMSEGTRSGNRVSRAHQPWRKNGCPKETGISEEQPQPECREAARMENQDRQLGPLFSPALQFLAGVSHQSNLHRNQDAREFSGAQGRKENGLLVEQRKPSVEAESRGMPIGMSTLNQTPTVASG